MISAWEEHGHGFARIGSRCDNSRKSVAIIGHGVDSSPRSLRTLQLKNYFRTSYDSIAGQLISRKLRTICSTWNMISAWEEHGHGFARSEAWCVTIREIRGHYRSSGLLLLGDLCGLCG
jgi:hypothetical protein